MAVRNLCAVFGNLGQIPSVCPREAHPVPVLQRVANLVIGDGLPIVLGKQIPPGGVGIFIGVRLDQNPGGIIGPFTQ